MQSKKQFVVYKSSAGSGKTTTLAIEYLKLCLPKPENFKHILALTFTKDSANEMKERIVQYLTKILKYQQTNEIDFILIPLLQAQGKWNESDSEETKKQSVKLLQKQAKDLLQLILHSYSDFAISTIDSFTHRIIRSFAHDLGISISFDVELKDDNILKSAVNELISRIGDEYPQLTSVLLEFSLHKIGNDKSRKIDEDLHQLAKNLLDDVKEEFLIELRKLTIDELLELKNQIFEETDQFRKFVNEEALLAKQLILKNGLNCKKFYYGTGNICNWFFELANPNFDNKSLSPKDRVLKSIDEDKWCSSSILPADRAKIESIQEELKSHFYRLRDFVEANSNDYLILSEMASQIYPLAVLIEIEKLVFQFKSESNILHISDFNKLIAKAIAGEPAPFIYERIGNWYKHFLIDEFQDTSSLQWNNLLPLIENGLSMGEFSLLVGDGKQSIYRWRGGDVSQFSELPNLLHVTDDLGKQREKILIENYASKELLQNFRSDEEIVHFNNAFFGFIEQSNWLASQHKQVYAQAKQTVAQEKRGFGIVDIQLIEPSDKDQMNAKIMEAIQIALNEGFQYRDMTILVRKNGPAAEYADLLMANKIPVISPVGLRVSSSAKVQFILSLFRYVLFPDEKIYQFEILRFLLDQQMLPKLSLSDYQTVSSELQQSSLGFSAAFASLLKDAKYEIDLKMLSHFDVYELAEYFIRLFGLTQPDPYLHFFLDNIHEFKLSPYTQLADFLLWWEENKLGLFIDMPKGLNAVTIQTIFKAKGLQYAVVIFPIPDNSLITKNKKNTSWLNPGIERLEKLKFSPFSINKLQNTRLSSVYEQEQANSKLDDINLLYVAMTRAEHRLFILADQIRNKDGKSIPSPYDGALKPSFLFRDFLANHKECQLNDAHFRFGKMVSLPAEKPLDESGFYYLKSLQSERWRNYLELANTEELADQFEKKNLQNWGIQVHEILASILTVDDKEKAMNTAFYKGLINQQEVDMLSIYFDQLFLHPSLEPFYTSGALSANEAEIVDAFGLIHRPDRLVFFDDKTVIIDYKTGKENEKHKSQIFDYAQLMALLNYPKPESYLVYLNETIKVIAI